MSMHVSKSDCDVKSPLTVISWLESCLILLDSNHAYLHASYLVQLTNKWKTAVCREISVLRRQDWCPQTHLCFSVWFAMPVLPAYDQVVQTHTSMRMPFVLSVMYRQPAGISPIMS